MYLFCSFWILLFDLVPSKFLSLAILSKSVGNAPTALLRICELAEEGIIRPRLVVGVPVGFVNVVESKERLIQSGLPCIVARGRKGGSNVAAAICNALLYSMGTN